MIYNILAKYYDELVKDDEATKQWLDFIVSHSNGKRVLELACGSGEITIALANANYMVDASDLSASMIEEAKKKQGSDKVNFFVMDMRDYHVKEYYDVILCLCDSINYLIHKKDIEMLFSHVASSLNTGGTFIFDMHSLDRIEEFKEEFYEAGIVSGHEYTWSIIEDDMHLYHNFIFYDENANMKQEQHIQRIYDPAYIKEVLEPYFTVEIYTDFTKKGIVEGEKYFYVCKKKEDVQ